MSKAYIFYNPLADNGRCKAAAEAMSASLERSFVLCDMTQPDTYATVLFSMAPEDILVLCGGDGTLHHFINLTRDVEIKNEIYYCPLGSGNDFARDCGHSRGDSPFPIGDCLTGLPEVTVNGRRYRFLNGIGYGIDGYCCVEGDKLRGTGKKINYTAIAIRGLLLHYKPTNARVTVDGVTHSYSKVWLAPTMVGRFYGGGMMPTPQQDRKNRRQLSTMVFHGSGKLRTLMIFPSIFKGEHVKHKKQVEILTGHTITVEFDRPTPLQIDGETILGVTSYTATCAAVPETAGAGR